MEEDTETDRAAVIPSTEKKVGGMITFTCHCDPPPLAYTTFVSAVGGRVLIRTVLASCTKTYMKKGFKTHLPVFQSLKFPSYWIAKHVNLPFVEKARLRLRHFLPLSAVKTKTTLTSHLPARRSMLHHIVDRSHNM